VWFTRRDLIFYGLVISVRPRRIPSTASYRKHHRGLAVSAYLAAMWPSLFTAASYGKMSGAFPSAGSAYTYAQRALNPHVGFLAGWA